MGNDYFHVSAPLISLRDDALSKRWIAEAERRTPYFHRVQQQLALVDVLLGRDHDATARLARAAAREPGNIEVTQTRSEVAFIVDSPEQEALVAPLIKTSAGTVGVWLAETPRVRYAYALGKRGEAEQASRLLDVAERAARTRIDGGDETPAWRVELAAVHALKKDRAASLDALAPSLRRRLPGVRLPGTRSDLRAAAERPALPKPARTHASRCRDAAPGRSRTGTARHRRAPDAVALIAARTRLNGALRRRQLPLEPCAGMPQIAVHRGLGDAQRLADLVIGPPDRAAVDCAPAGATRRR